MATQSLSLRSSSEQLERVLQVLDAHSDPEVCRIARTAVSLLVDLYGAGLARMVELTRAHGDAALLDEFGRDALVGPLLAVRGDHPHTLGDRVQHALDDVHASLDVEGCDISIASLEGSRLRLGITHGARACGSTMAAVQRAIETTLFDLVPELTDITFEDRHVQSSAVIPLEGLRHGGMATAGTSREVRA